MDLPPGFALETRLGSGGMGEVWAARHLPTGWPVALKLHHPGRDDDDLALVREARAAAGLDHPGIVEILDFGRTPGGRSWLAMERVDGTALGSALPRDWTEAARILGAILLALAHAHARDVVHRDLKPDNVLLERATGRVVLTDFGLAWAGRDPRTHVRAGTPHYAAPEQIAGRVDEIGPRTDLYALGATAWALVTGRAIRADLGPREAARAALAGALPPLAPRLAVPDAFPGWLTTLLAADPAGRFRCAADALASLEALGPATGTPAAPLAMSAADATLPDLSAVGWDEVAASPPEVPGLPRVRPPPPGPRPRAYEGPQLALLPLRRPPLIGREGPWDALWTALEEVEASRRPLCVRIGGPEGVGRRHLARCFLAAARETGRADGRWVDDAAALRPDDGRERARVLVLPDAEATDDGRRALARAVLGEGPVLLVTVAGPGPAPVPASLARTIELGPLSRAEIGSLVQALVDLDVAVVERIADASGGFPLVALALVAAHLDAPAGLAEGADALRGAWRRRLEALRAEDRVALGVLVAGEPPVDRRGWLDACRERGVADPEGVAAELVRAGLVELDVAEVVACAHPLLRDATRDHAGPAEHAAWARALAAVEPRDDRRLGLHLAGAGDAAAAAPLLADAGTATVRRGDLREGARLLRRWQEQVRAAGDEPIRADPSALHLLVEVVHELGDLAAHEALVDEVERAADGRADVGVAVAFWRARIARLRGDREAAVRLLREADARCGGRRVLPWLRPGVLARELGRALLDLRDLPAARIALRRAVEASAASLERQTRVAALGFLGHVEVQAGDPDAAERAWREALAVTDEVRDPQSWMPRWMALSGLADLARDRGDLDAAEALYRSCREALVEHGHGAAPMADVNLATVRLLRGDLDGARRLAIEARRELVRRDLDDLAVPARLVATLAAARLGLDAEVEAGVADLERRLTRRPIRDPDVPRFLDELADALGGRRPDLAARARSLRARGDTPA